MRTDSGSLAQVIQIAVDEGGAVASVRKKGKIEQFRNLKSLRSLDELSVDSSNNYVFFLLSCNKSN